MNVTWQRLAGATNRFALKVALLDDPDAGSGATPDESASWGAYEVWVDGHNLCAHTEQGERVDAVHWYLLPLLEWIVGHWDPLLHEERLPVRNAAATAWPALRETRLPPPGLTDRTADAQQEDWRRWWSRHSLQACREGGLFPDIVLRRWRSEVEVSWGATPLPGQPPGYRFAIDSGACRLPPSEVAEPLYAIVVDAVEELLRRNPGSTRLLALRRKARALRNRDHQLRRLAWLAGLGRSVSAAVRRWKKVLADLQPYAPGPRDAVLQAGADRLVVAGTCHAALMFGSVSPTVSDDDMARLTRWLVRFSSDQGDPAALQALMMRVGDVGPQIWQEAFDQGYDLALDALDALDGDGPIPVRVDLEDVYDRLGITIESDELDDATVRAVALAGPHHTPGVVVNTSYPGHDKGSVRRFTLAHELCHLLVDRPRGKPLAVASGPWAPLDVERRANAFAAMFLMPPDRVRRALTGSIETLDNVRDVAEALGTSLRATLEHLGNLGFIDDATRLRLRQDCDLLMELGR